LTAVPTEVSIWTPSVS